MAANPTVICFSLYLFGNSTRICRHKQLLFCAYIFRQNNTTIKPFQKSSYLVKEGIFEYSRNPIYLAMTIVLIGWWIFLGSLTPVSIIPLFTWLIQEKFIKQEEQMLETEFGEEYQEYKATVRRWF
jgi:protein-S-isoprenylcysteine O-methyltransferase Ste14